MISYPYIRPIQQNDNLKMAQIIRQVMTEYGCVGCGYSIEDAEVDTMYETYNNEKSQFYVIEIREGEVSGGGGIAPLEGGDTETCELKKMYFLPDLRGKKMGNRLIEMLLNDAKKLGYTFIYLETVERMKEAQALYTKVGFQKLTSHLGNTGHSSCDSFYLKKL